VLVGRFATTSKPPDIARGVRGCTPERATCEDESLTNRESTLRPRRFATTLRLSFVWKGRSSSSRSRLSNSVISSAVLGFLILFNAREMCSPKRRREFAISRISSSSSRKMNLVYSDWTPDVSVGFETGGV
jgi:hypothetical protein